MKRLLPTGVVLGLFLAAAPPATSDPGAGPAAAEAMVKADCHRCHQVPGTEPAERIDSCADCHAWIRGIAASPAKREKAMEVFPLWERYEKNVASYLAVPSLEASMARLEPEWVKGYLTDPHDLRPGLPETMPRFDLEDEELQAIVAGFTPAEVPETRAPDPENVEEGARLFLAKGCATCHTFGALHADITLAHAPDLAHTRDRVHPDRAAAWIKNPKSISEAATMPGLPLTDAEVLALRDYVYLADPGWETQAALGDPPEPTTAPVTYAEVEERVFGKICIHCHMDPEANEGRAGPGNAGGFGWPATGIQLETLEGIRAAADKIPDALLRRRVEAHRDAVEAGNKPAALTRPEKPGMPLGLPPLPDEDISLVLGWIEQGTPE